LLIEGGLDRRGSQVRGKWAFFGERTRDDRGEAVSASRILSQPSSSDLELVRDAGICQGKTRIDGRTARDSILVAYIQNELMQEPRQAQGKRNINIPRREADNSEGYLGKDKMRRVANVMRRHGNVFSGSRAWRLHGKSGRQ
jgi:hypothetical protein